MSLSLSLSPSLPNKKKRWIGESTEDIQNFMFDKYNLSRAELFREGIKNWWEIHTPFLKSFKPSGADMQSMGRARAVGGGPGATFGLFTGPIVSRGTPEQIKEFVTRARQAKILGCYAQTVKKVPSTRKKTNKKFYLFSCILFPFPQKKKKIP